MTWRTHDIGAIVKGTYALVPNVVTDASTGAGGDGIEQNGAAIDRADQTTISHPYRSAKIIVPYTYIAGTSAATGAIVMNAQESTSSTAWTDFADKDGSTRVGTTITNATTAGTTATGVLEMDLDLGSRGRYFRIQVTPTLTSTVASSVASDTLAIGAVAVLGGGVEHPAQ